MKYCRDCACNIHGLCSPWPPTPYERPKPMPVRNIKVCRGTYLSFGKYEDRLLQDVIRQDPKYVLSMLQNKVEEPFDEYSLEAFKDQIPLMIDEILKEEPKNSKELEELKKEIEKVEINVGI